MKTINITYWIFTIIFAALMLFSAIPNAMVDEQSIEVFHKQLGYPVYFIPFIGIGKIIGVITILQPRFPLLKEWAYAGLFFDLTGATYSIISIGVPASQWMGMFMFIIPGIVSYIFYRKRVSAKAQPAL